MKNEREFGLPPRRLLDEASGYTELFHSNPSFADAQKALTNVWAGWKAGPETQKSDITPARKEFIKSMSDWMDKNIK